MIKITNSSFFQYTKNNRIAHTKYGRQIQNKVNDNGKNNDGIPFKIEIGVELYFLETEKEEEEVDKEVVVGEKAS